MTGRLLGGRGQTQAKWLPPLPAASRTLLESLPASVLQDTRATAAIAQVSLVDILGSTLECMGWLSHLLSNLSFIPPACFSQLLSLEVDPCASGHGGCSPYANCTKVAPGQRTCTCQDGYTGDGELCQGEVSLTQGDRHV
jgi:hypothetical protein